MAYRTVGNTVVEWDDNAPFIFTMAEQTDSSSDRPAASITIDLVGLREGFEDTFLMHLREHLMERCNRVALKSIAKLLFGSVIRHLENLAHTHNRCIADDPAALGEHMLALIEKGLDKATLEQYAIHLIEEVHQINHLLKDRLLARRLEQAFVAGEVVKLLDDSGIKNGALIKYHNPTRHSEPLLELALDAHGGRKQVVNDELVLISMYSQFAPKALCLTDERHLIEPDDNEEDD